MPSRISLAIYVLLLTTLPHIVSAKIGHCALLSAPDLPPARHPSKSPTLQALLKNLTTTLDAVVLNPENTTTPLYGPIDTSNTTFSIQIFSRYDEGLGWEYHYDAPGLASDNVGVKQVDGGSVYRIGSVSKLLTVYTWLISQGDKAWGESIVRYIPELEEYVRQRKDMQEAGQEVGASGLDETDWESITIGSLTNHLSGISSNTAGNARMDGLIGLLLPPSITLPKINSSIPTSLSDDACPNPLASPCDRKAFISSILLTHPLLAPFTSPAYSQIAFSLLALALENITSTPFPALFQTSIIDSLNLTNTYYTNPLLTHAVIPHNDTSGFTADLKLVQPAGGYYSSTSDLSKIGRAILDSTLLSKVQTSRWLKPAAFTANPDFFIGSPWEIMRAPSTSSSSSSSGGNTKTNHVYTKTGHLGSYYSNFVLIPDEGWGFVVLAAGDDSERVNTVISDVVAQIGVNAFEAAQKEEGRGVYAGVYVGGLGAGDLDVGEEVRKGEGEVLELAVDEFPGLLVKQWVLNGTGMIAGFAEVGMELRLNPSGLTSTRIVNGRKVVREGWRMVILREEEKEGAFVVNCMEWFEVGAAIYGGLGLDEWVLDVVEGDGEVGSGGRRAVGVGARGFRGVYGRV